MEVGVHRFLRPSAKGPRARLKLRRVESDLEKPVSRASPMRRVAVIGCAGAGKSTFSVRLGDITGIPVVHLDRHFWKPGWVETPTEEWRAVVSRLASEEQWIMDGNYSSTLDLRLPLADTIVFFDYPRRICAYRVFKRSALGRPRPDLPENCSERIFGADFFSFFAWVWTFNTRSRPKIESALSMLSHDPSLIRLTSDDERNQLLRRLLEV